MDHGEQSTSSGSGLAHKDYARGYWSGISGCIAFLVVIRVANMLQRKQRLSLQQRRSQAIPSRPQGSISQAYATATAITRELLYSQPVYFTGRISRYFTPLPIGRWLLLIMYWIVILSFLWDKTIIRKGDPMYAYRWEKVAFRAAWVSVTQVPFLYLLSCRWNPITLLTGISYERFNWLHRWAARTLFLTVIVHWSFFYHSWTIYEIVSTQMIFMPMVKWGFAAWGVLTWMILSGFGVFRDLNYEFFVIQHIAGAGVMLWLLFVHVPKDAQYNIWISVAFLAFDWAGRILHGTLQNTHVLGRLKSKVPGYELRLEALPGEVTRVTIEDVDFGWMAGQHVYINIPSLRPFENHPFTIANAPENPSEAGSKTLIILIQARLGFSRSVHNAAVKDDGHDHRRRAFLSGPWGTPPQLSHYETVVLVATSTGASFVVPLLQAIVRSRGCVRNVELHWIVRTEDHIGWFRDELEALMRQSQGMELKPQIRIHVTRSQEAAREVETQYGSVKVEVNVEVNVAMESLEQRSSMSSMPSMESGRMPLSPLPPQQNGRQRVPTMIISHGRPTIESLIQPAVEHALGETAIVACGGLSIAAQTRTYVAKLADERAVHKGTGAQGIYLFTETYGW